MKFNVFGPLVVLGLSLLFFEPSAFAAWRTVGPVSKTSYSSSLASCRLRLRYNTTWKLGNDLHTAVHYLSITSVNVVTKTNGTQSSRAVYLRTPVDRSEVEALELAGIATPVGERYEFIGGGVLAAAVGSPTGLIEAGTWEAYLQFGLDQSKLTLEKDCS